MAQHVRVAWNGRPAFCPARLTSQLKESVVKGPPRSDTNTNGDLGASRWMLLTHCKLLQSKAIAIDRVAAAERRIDNDRSSNLTGDARGRSGRSSNCPSSNRNYGCAASLSDGSIELSRHPGEHVEGPLVG
jgi:hypothetical protein